MSRSGPGKNSARLGSETVAYRADARIVEGLDRVGFCSLLKIVRISLEALLDSLPSPLLYRIVNLNWSATAEPGIQSFMGSERLRIGID